MEVFSLNKRLIITFANKVLRQTNNLKRLTSYRYDYHKRTQLDVSII